MSVVEDKIQWIGIKELVEIKDYFSKHKSRISEYVAIKVSIARYLRYNTTMTLHDIASLLNTSHCSIVHYVSHIKDSEFLDELTIEQAINIVQSGFYPITRGNKKTWRRLEDI